MLAKWENESELSEELIATRCVCVCGGGVGEKQKRSEGQVCLRGADSQQRQFTVAHGNSQTDNASACRGQACPLTLDDLPKAVGGSSQGHHQLRMCPPNVCGNFI